jgi:flagellar export protein FliJ
VKKYTFSLAKVLRVRRIEEKQAAGRLAAARASAIAAVAKEVGATQALASRCARGGLQSSASFLAWVEARTLAGEALTDARTEVKAADEELESRRVDWSSAAARVSALEHLDERGREAHAVERRRDETKTSDDIVMTRWERP